MVRKRYVGVIGAGRWGWTIAHLIERKHKGRVIIWSKDDKVVRSINETGINPKRFSEFPLKVRATSDLEELFLEAEVIFVAVSTSGFRDVISKSAKYIWDEHIIVSASKGLEPRTCKRMTEIIKDETPCNKIGVLSGPNISAEIIRGEPSGVVVASAAEIVFERVRDILHTPYFRVYPSCDVIGVEMGGALKNVYAISAGVLDSLGFKLNALSVLFSQALTEMIRLGCKMGAKQETFLGLSGAGDLFATISYESSRNRTFGKLIGSGLTPSEALSQIGETVEGYITTEAAYELSEKMNVKMNIVKALYDLIYHKRDARDFMAEIFASGTNEEPQDR